MALTRHGFARSYRLRGAVLEHGRNRRMRGTACGNGGRCRRDRMTALTRRALTFFGAGEQLLGIISLPAHTRTRGMLIVIGGPQYRVGSHRQFTLLADYLARRGTPTMR